MEVIFLEEMRWKLCDDMGDADTHTICAQMFPKANNVGIVVEVVDERNQEKAFEFVWFQYSNPMDGHTIEEAYQNGSEFNPS